MNRPRPRLTVRRLMVAVAIFALLVWSTAIAWRWFDYRREALHYENVCQTLAGEVSSFGEQIEQARSRGKSVPEGLEQQLVERKKAFADEKRLADAYRRAMSQPWRKARVRVVE